MQLTEVNKTGRRKIAPSRAAASVEHATAAPERTKNFTRLG
jgi:hypothetical protein